MPDNVKTRAESGTVLVTGAAGFIGRHVCRHYASSGGEVIGVDRAILPDAALAYCTHTYSSELSDKALETILQRHRPAICVHCAGSATVPGSVAEPSKDFAAGPLLTFTVLDALRQHAPGCRFTFLSSAAVYGNPTRLPIHESDPLRPISPYGYHKWQCELLCREFQHVYGLPTASVRIFSAYGPGLRRQVIWDICHKVFTQSELRLQGTGQESRDFIHAHDIARALYLIGQDAPMQGEVYNLATGIETTIHELATMVMDAAEITIPIRFSGSLPPGTPLNWRADIGAVASLGFSPLTSLEQGLADFISWSSPQIERRQNTPADSRPT